MVLFGGSIIAGGDILAEAIQNEVAKKNILSEVLDTQQRH